MAEGNPAAPLKLDRAVAPRERLPPRLAPLLAVGLLVLLTVAAIRVGDGSVAVALAPCLVAMLVLAFWYLPLRVPMLALLVMSWAIEAPGDAFALELVTTPWRRVGELLWGKLNDVIHFEPLVFSGFDVVALLLFGVVAYRQLHRSTIDRTAEWVDTPRSLGFFVWLSLGAVAWISLYGLARGGSFRYALWQAIRWVHLPIVYSLMRQALRGGVDAETVGKLILGVGLFRAGEAILFRWWFPSLQELPFATTHYDSVIFATCVLIVLAMLLEMRGRRLLPISLALLFVYFWAMRDNNRRLVWAQVSAGVAVFWLMTPWRPLKLALARLLVLGALPLMIYVAVGWGSNAGIFAPVRKIRSMTDSQVNTSTLWRELENYDLVWTYSQRPILGSGFGHPFEQPIILPDVTSVYELEPYIPHNSVLGLWAFGGLIGFAGIWAMFPVGFFFTARAYRWARTPLERVTALGAAGAQVSFLMQGYGDLGFGAWGPVFTVATAYALVGKICIANGAWVHGRQHVADERRKAPVAA